MTIIRISSCQFTILDWAKKRSDFNLEPTIVMETPYNEPFITAVLESFVDAKEQVCSNYQQINAQQAEAAKSRRPVGFTTGSHE